MLGGRVARRAGRAVLRRIDRLAVKGRHGRWNRSIRQPGEPEPFDFHILHGPPGAAEERAWRALLARADWSSLCVGPEFFAECCTGQGPFAVLAMDGDRVAAALTGWSEGAAVVCGLTCRPHVCFDLETDYARAGAALVQGLLTQAGDAPLVTVYGWEPLEALRRAGFHQRHLEGTVVLDLRQGPGLLFKRLDAGRRRNIRLAIKRGVEVFEASSEADAEAYYDVYCRWRRTQRKSIYGDLVPLPAFVRYAARRDVRRLFLARHAGQIIAGLVVHFSRAGVLENVESASMDEHLHLRPNDLLIWKSIEWGCAEGLSRYSMTGAHPFFQRLGGVVVPVCRQRLDRSWLRRHDLQEVWQEGGGGALVRAIARRFLGRGAP